MGTESKLPRMKRVLHHVRAAQSVKQYLREQVTIPKPHEILHCFISNLLSCMCASSFFFLLKQHMVYFDF